MTKKPIAIFDIDGTIFRSSLFLELVLTLVEQDVFPASVQKQIDRYRFHWFDRVGTYGEYIEAVVKIYDKEIVGARAAGVKKICKELIKNQNKRVYVFTRDMINKIRGKYTLIAITGSPIEMVNEFNKYWKFDYVLASEREINKKGFFTDKMIYKPVHDKKRAMLEFAELHNFNFKKSIGVGDTESDIGFLSLVSRPICFNPNNYLLKEAKKRGWEIVVERKDVIYKIK